MSDTLKGWWEAQAEYWDRVAGSYDQLYSSPWSLRENQQTEEWLDQCTWVKEGTLLDLACGTGLGYELTAKKFSGLQYEGIDISMGMLGILGRKYPQVRVHHGGFGDLSRFGDRSFRYVICLNGAFSFAPAPLQTLLDLHRILEPTGAVFLSVLNRWSLRRLLSLRFRRTEMYSTRNTPRSAGAVPALVYSARGFSLLVARCGFAVTDLHAQGLLAGVIENPRLIPLEVKLSRWMPSRCHLLNVVARPA